MQQHWQPTADIETLKQRAQYLADVRCFFSQRAIWEVDTPSLSQAAPTAPYMASFSTDYQPIGSEQSQTYYLHTSPEFAMKRLLAAGSGSIYQIAKVFRNGEQGRLHSPEFTMLEWYRPSLSLSELMDEVQALLSSVFKVIEFQRLSYQQLFKQYTNIDVLTCSDTEIQHYGKANINSLPADFETDRDGWLELIMSYLIEPKLTQCTFIHDYPASQAQLAKVVKDEQGHDVADRFELYLNGVELANGYNELLDADELRKRFNADNLQRQQLNTPQIPIDENLLAAMEAGLPECSGVALGLDRLMMQVMAKDQISDVLSFNLERS